MVRKRMANNDSQAGPIEARVIGLLASLIFSIPTAVLLWVGVNKELAHWGGFLGSSYLLGCMVAFAVLALLLPRLFPAILGGVWRWMMKIERYWGW